jgi:hypothetical protein
MFRVESAFIGDGMLLKIDRWWLLLREREEIGGIVT